MKVVLQIVWWNDCDIPEWDVSLSADLLRYRSQADHHVWGKKGADHGQCPQAKSRGFTSNSVRLTTSTRWATPQPENREIECLDGFVHDL